jgi:predicted phosphodiesterase
LLHEFYAEQRYYLIYGNHDIEKRSPNFVKKNLTQYYNSHTDKEEPLFEGIETHEGLILQHRERPVRILLVHGHQGDLLSDIFWRVGRLLTRYFWRRLEFFGHKDPTRAATNYEKERKVERKIKDWVIANNQPVIAAHTHRPCCPPEDEPPYLNDGSCVQPNCITCIEITNSEITLVKWDIKTREDRTVFVDREPLAIPRKL